LKFEITVRLENGDEKVASLNNTSKAALMDGHGENSDGWVGREARVEIITQKVVACPIFCTSEIVSVARK